MQGVIAAAPTPIDQNLNPIKELFLEHSKWALANGCDGLNILGSTGEANSFDLKTRQRVMLHAIEDLPKNRLMVGTAAPSLQETIYLTEYADELGYEIALVYPHIIIHLSQMKAYFYGIKHFTMLWASARSKFISTIIPK